MVMPRPTIGAQFFPIMLRYPRIEVIKRTLFVPTYREEYEVQIMRPNRPMKSKYGMSKAQANAHWKSHTNLTHPGKYFRPSKVKIMRPTSPK